MSVKFYADVNINKAITVGLRLKEADVLTAEDFINQVIFL